METLCKKIQLEILDEVIKKFDGEHPVEIDRTDPIREFNLQHLYRHNCFLLFPGLVDIATLSEEGHQYRLELVAEFKEEQRKDETLALLRKRVRFAGIALVISIISLVVSVGAIIASWVALFR